MCIMHSMATTLLPVEIKMECPSCSGSGKILGFFAIRVDGGCDPCREFQCLRCKGSGTVLDEMTMWIAAGKTMREDRRSRRNTLRKEAEKRKMKPSELSAMEQGRVKPEPT